MSDDFEIHKNSGGKVGHLSDMEAELEEILSQFSDQIAEMNGIAEPANAIPEIDKAKTRILDLLSNTIIHDPH